MWSYGADRHLGFPTLGRIYFGADGAWQLYGPEPPPFRQLMPEVELRKMLRCLGDDPRAELKHDPLWVIKSVNMLLPLGREKASWVLEQYLRVKGPIEEMNRQRADFILMRALFECPVPPGYMRVPAIGAISPAEPSDMRSSPLSPLVLRDQVPFDLCEGALVRGPVELPADALSYYRTYPLRKRLLVPSDDPFETFQQFLSTSQWPWPKGADRRSHEAFVLEQVLTLVRHVYRPVDFRLPQEPVKADDVDKYHREFLSLGVYWDSVRQDYVRKDRLVLPDLVNPPAKSWDPPQFGGCTVRIELQRHGESDEVSVGIRSTVTASLLTHPVILRIYDEKSGDLMRWAAVDDPSKQGVQEAEMLKHMRTNPSRFNDSNWGVGGGTWYKAGLGASVRLELATIEGVVSGPILDP